MNNNNQELNREYLVAYLVEQVNLNNRLAGSSLGESNAPLFQLARNFGLLEEVQENLNPEHLN